MENGKSICDCNSFMKKSLSEVMIRPIDIGKRRVGPGYPTYIVAEMSANHNQDFEQAVQILYAAKDSGADAVKIQTYTPDTLTIQCDNDYFRIKDTIWNGRTLYDLYSKAFTPWEWQPTLKKKAEELGMDLFSSAFDPSAVDFLEEMNVQVHKVASFEIVDIPLIERMALTGKPIIVSTGMSTKQEIEEAILTIRNSGNSQIVLLKCTSAYPAPPEEMNLRSIPDMMESFQLPTGLSDHSLGIEVPVAAVTLGACIIEKHFTLSRDIPGPDSAFSLEPGEFKKMVNAVRTTEKALGSVCYGPGKQESKSSVFRRSLFVVEDMKAGDKFAIHNIRSIRPGFGLHTRHLNEIIGQKARSEIKRGTPLTWDMVEKTNT